MGLKELTTTWEEEFLEFRGIDKRTDRSLVPTNFLTDASNCVLERGILRSRLGSSQWGTLSFASVAGTTRRMMTVDVGASDYVLVHRGTGIWYGLKGASSPTRILDIAGGNLTVADAESEFENFGYTVGVDGTRVVKVLFKQAAGCKELQFNSATGLWTGLNAGIASSTFSFVLSELVGGGTNQAAGTYRVRLVAQRKIGAIRTSESASTGKNTSTLEDKGYQEITLAAATNRIQAVITHSGLDAQVTHFQFQVTKVLNFASGSVYSSNGNDPTLYFECTTAATAASPITVVLNVADDQLELVCPDLIGYEPLPGHVISVYAGGVLFFGGIAPYHARIFYSGLSGYYYHNTLYNPLAWIPADEGDGQLLTDLEIVSDHLCVFKEGKTGILPNKNIEAPIVWRDKRIGTLHRSAAANISEDQLIVLCQDGILRLFDGVSYTDKKDLGESQAAFSDVVRPITESIDPSTVTYMWHKERLHLLYGAAGARKALVLHPREGFGWTTWTGLQHEWNGLIDNGNSWVFLYNNLLYEQSPSTPVYTDFGGTAIAWSATFAPLHPKNRRNKIWLKQSLLEGSFANLFNAVFRTDGGYITSSAVNSSPDPTLSEFQYIQWLKLFPDRQIFGQFAELTLAGNGSMIIRKHHWVVIEKDTGSAGWSFTAPYERYYFAPVWASNVILHITFDADSTTARDYSGHNRDHLWSNGTGGSRAHDAALIPGGGESAVAGSGSGWTDADWTAMDYIGDSSGLNSASLTYEYVVSFPSLASMVVIQEGGNGNYYWRMLANTNGSLEYQIYTSALSYKFTTAAGTVAAGATQYTIQFVLSNGGQNGQFYAAPRTSAFAITTTTRSAL